MGTNYICTYRPSIKVNENTKVSEIEMDIKKFCEISFFNIYNKSSYNSITDFISNNNVIVDLNGYLSNKQINVLNFLNFETLLPNAEMVAKAVKNDALQKICRECEQLMGEKQVACPWRSISNEYCEEYEEIKEKLEILDIIYKNSSVLETNQKLEILIDLWKTDQESEIEKIKKWLKKEYRANSQKEKR